MANDDKPKKIYTNRTREIEYKIRLTEDEFNFLRTQKIASGCRTRRDFIMQLARNGYIFNCNNLIPELVKQGTNLNQIAKKIGKNPKEVKKIIEEKRESCHATKEP